MQAYCPRPESWKKRWLLPVLTAVAFAAASPAYSAFHLWTVQEIYTDASGSLQFIELHTTETGQNFVNGMNVTAAPGNRLTGHTITLPGDSLPGDTAGHSLLFGTAGLQAAGGPAPDYIIPDNFLFSGAGNLNFFDAVFATFTPLPTDGVLSRTVATGLNAPNSPQNYAGLTGFVIAPEPSGCALLGLGAVLSFVAKRRAGHR
jgi:hypothetical protein